MAMNESLVIEKVGEGTQGRVISARGALLATSPIFVEPRAKGAWLRTMRGAMPGVKVQDMTTRAYERLAGVPDGSGGGTTSGANGTGPGMATSTSGTRRRSTATRRARTPATSTSSSSGS